MLMKSEGDRHIERSRSSELLKREGGLQLYSGIFLDPKELAVQTWTLFISFKPYVQAFTRRSINLISRLSQRWMLSLMSGQLP
jgi:hypothetical protein